MQHYIFMVAHKHYCAKEFPRHLVLKMYIWGPPSKILVHWIGSGSQHHSLTSNPVIGAGDYLSMIGGKKISYKHLKTIWKLNFYA